MALQDSQEVQNSEKKVRIYSGDLTTIDYDLFLEFQPV
jgi:hypothetical protein